MSNIKILSQYIKSFSFNTPQSPEVFLTAQEKPDIKITIDIDAKKISTDHYEIILKLSANAAAQKHKLFDLEITYAGLFLLKNLQSEMLEQVLLIFCPNLLFPFVRRIIATTTTDSGFAPLMLDPIDFADLYQRRKKAEKAKPINDTMN